MVDYGLGFTFNDIHSSTFQMVIKSKNRPLLPQRKKFEDDVTGRDEPWDFEEYVDEGTYENRIIEVECDLLSDSVADLRTKVRSIASWLSSGRKKLIFDDEPGLYYSAKLYNNIGLENFISLGKFSIIFDCKPMAYNVSIRGQDIILDSEIPLDSMVQLDYSALSFNIDASPKTITLENLGTRSTLPYFTLTGSFSTVVMSANGNALTFAEENFSGQLDLDHKLMTVKKGGLNKLDKVTGEFLKLIPGTNQITFTGCQGSQLVVYFVEKFI
jgi:predicted phage tail component-like protein